MIEFLGYTLEDLMRESVNAAREQGVATREEWDDLVEQVVDDKREFEEIHADDETETIVAELRGRWPDYVATL